jgi:ribonuclease J
MAAMYRWTRPRIAVPAHGEALHLAEHAAFARAQGVPEVVRARNGTVVRLAPGRAEIIDDVPVGRLYRDGDLLVPESERAIPERKNCPVGHRLGGASRSTARAGSPAIR